MTGADKVVLHICCAPCLAGPLKLLRDEGLEVTGFFYNPNIHPLIEFRRRLKALKVFRESDDAPMVFCEEYGLEEFLREVYDKASSPPERCRNCYKLRLTATAATAKKLEARAFTTTLLASRHQDHEMIRNTGAEIGESQGIEFLYRDMRPTCGLSDDTARRRHLYRQSYCGCVFSEFERYRETTKHIYGAARGDDNEN